MAGGPPIRGIDSFQETNPNAQWRDTRDIWTRVAAQLENPQVVMVTLFFLGGLGAIMPSFADVSLLFGLLVIWWVKTRIAALPIKIPKRTGVLDAHELQPGTRKPQKAQGVFYLGNEMKTGEEIWISTRDACAHGLVLATTGGGKTEMFLGICENVLNQGSGFMFVDGKAQSKVWMKLHDLCRAKGRDDDLHVINFMTGAKDITGAQPNKISHTMQPYSHGSSSMCAQLTVGLMSSPSERANDDMWKDRAIAFTEALMRPLVYLRDNYGVPLDVNEVRKYFELERVEELAWKGHERYPGAELVLDALKTYVVNLPGYERQKFGKRGGQEQTVRDQHGYITMQLVRAFTSLADTYGHIVRTRLGEVDFKDIVLNRRILVVMLPSLEKSPSETAMLGKLTVSALKGIMVEGLGSTVEGDRKTMEDGGAASLPTPYTVILDEYGYYAVKGFAIAFAQARSLGFSIWVGGQDMPSFQRESKEEAMSVCGNTGVKLFGKIEDPETTLKFVLERGGKATMTRSAGFDSDPGALGTSYLDNMSANYEHVDRINPADVVDQIEGEFHMTWRSKIIRARTFYVNPPPSKKIRLNHFIPVQAPDVYLLQELQALSSGVHARLVAGDLSRSIDCAAGREKQIIDVAADALRQHQSALPIERGIAAVVAVGADQVRYVQAFKDAVAQRKSEQAAAGAPELYQRVSGEMARVGMGAGANGMDFVALAAPGAANPAQPQPADSAGVVQGGEGLLVAAAPVLGADALALVEDEDPADDDVATPAGAAEPRDVIQAPSAAAATGTAAERPGPVQGSQAGFGAAVFESETSSRAQVIEASLPAEEDTFPLLDIERTKQGLTDIEKHLGASDQQASEAANALAGDISVAMAYPKNVPPTKAPEDLMTMLLKLGAALEAGNDQF